MALSFSISYTFSPGTTISSSQVNTNFSDESNVWNGLEAKTKTLSNLGVDTQLKSGGTIEAASGSVGAPSIIFTASTTTGFYLSAAGIIGIATGNTLIGVVANVVPNILDNGGMEIWQRGTSFTAPASLTYTADRWQTVTDEAANVTVTKETTTIDSIGLAAMKVVITSVGASKKWYVVETLENYADYRGRSITVSARVSANVATACRIQIFDGVTTTTSSYHTGGSNFETLSVTAAIGAAITQIQIQVGMVAAGDKKNGTYYFDSVMGNLGAEAVAFVPINMQVDLARCQRFYYRIAGDASTAETGVGFCVSTTHAYVYVQYPVPMRVAPTMTVVAATGFSVNNASAGANAATAVTPANITVAKALLDVTVASGLVAGDATRLFGNASTTYIDVTADL